MRFRAAAVSALVLAPAALAGAAGSHLIGPSAIGAGKLGQTRAAYTKAYGKVHRVDQLELGLTRVSYPGPVDVYFTHGGKSGIAIVTAGAAFRTAAGVGPCSTAAAVRKAHPGVVKVALAGPEYALRLGGSLWFEIESGKVAAVALGSRQAAFFAANTTPCGSS